MTDPTVPCPEISALTTRLRSVVAAPLTRFAPAPTGFLHLGHVANAVYVWGLAGALGGRVLLRLEDHDRQRCRPEHEQALLEDLDWLGLVPDVFPTAEFRQGRCDGRQSDRHAAYRDALAPLDAAGLVYGCDCTRRQVGEGRYPGTCRTRGIPLRDGVGWRVRLGPGDEMFEDALLGPQRQSPLEQFGDVLVRDRLGNWTYQWAVTVDDLRQGVTLIIRGRDLLASTGLQIRLARLLGRTTPPRFVHHSLIMKSPSQKLSKSDGDTGIRELRAAGWSAAGVIGLAAHLVAVSRSPGNITAAGLRSLFRTGGSL